MASDQGYTIRQAKKGDMPGVLKLTSDHGFGHTIESLNCQFDLFPGGIFVAESSDGEIISHCAATILDDSTGFISSYITKPSMRCKGIGMQLFKLSCRALGDRNIGLNSKIKTLYASFGFSATELLICTYDCPIKNIILRTEELVSDSPFKVVPANVIDQEMILAYDRDLHQMEREKLVKWLLDFARISLVAVEAGNVKGWGTIYKTYQGYRLMPLYADTIGVAKALAHALLKDIAIESESNIEVAFPEKNTDAHLLYDNLGISSGVHHQRYRCFSKKYVPIQTPYVYSILDYGHVLS